MRLSGELFGSGNPDAIQYGHMQKMVRIVEEAAYLGNMALFEGARDPNACKCVLKCLVWSEKLVSPEVMDWVERHGMVGEASAISDVRRIALGFVQAKREQAVYLRAMATPTGYAYAVLKSMGPCGSPQELYLTVQASGLFAKDSHASMLPNVDNALFDNF